MPATLLWSLDVLEHHLRELLVRDFAVPVRVDLLDDLLDHGLIQVLAEGKHLLDLLDGDGAATIFVEHFEGRLQLVVAQQVLLVQRCDNELRVLDLAGAVGVDLLEQLVDFLVGELSAEELGISFLDLVLLELAVAVQVHGSEHLVDLLLLLLGQQLRGDEGVRGLLQFRRGIEVLQIR